MRKNKTHNEVVNDFFSNMKELKEAKPIAEAHYPFSVPLMDASTQFGTVACGDVKAEAEKLTGHQLDKVYILSVFSADVNAEPDAVSFVSNTNLNVYCICGKYIGVLTLSYEEKRS